MRFTVFPWSSSNLYREEWSDTSTKLGWSEVDYIHHHFFGDDDDNKDAVSYKTTQNKKDVSTTGSGLSLLRSNTRETLSAAEERISQALFSDLRTPSIPEQDENDGSSNDDDRVGGMIRPRLSAVCNKTAKRNTAYLYYSVQMVKSL